MCTSSMFSTLEEFGIMADGEEIEANAKLSGIKYYESEYHKVGWLGGKAAIKAKLNKVGVYGLSKLNCDALDKKVIEWQLKPGAKDI